MIMPRTVPMIRLGPGGHRLLSRVRQQRPQPLVPAIQRHSGGTSLGGCTPRISSTLSFQAGWKHERRRDGLKAILKFRLLTQRRNRLDLAPDRWSLAAWGGLTPGHRIGQPEPLFPRKDLAPKPPRAT